MAGTPDSDDEWLQELFVRSTASQPSPLAGASTQDWADEWLQELLAPAESSATFTSAGTSSASAAPAASARAASAPAAAAAAAPPAALTAPAVKAPPPQKKRRSEPEWLPPAVVALPRTDVSATKHPQKTKNKTHQSQDDNAGAGHSQ